MADAALTAERRDGTGKGPAGRARRDGLVPAVVYGLGEANVSVAVSARELTHILAGGANTLITLKVDGKDQLTLARQVQRNPVKGTLVHVDFVRVRADQTIVADVSVHLIGDAEGVNLGGVLEQLLHTVSIEARPTEIPSELECDVSSLGIGDGVRIRDLIVPPGVTVRHEDDELVAQVAAPRVAEEAAPAEGEAAEGEAAAEGGEGAAAGGGESSSEG
jgi:large subunit ribosomal protein L25